MDSPPLAETSDPVRVLPEPSIAVRSTVSFASSVPLRVIPTAYAPEFERLTALLLAHERVLPLPSITVAPTHTIGCMTDIIIAKTTRVGRKLFLSF